MSSGPIPSDVVDNFCEKLFPDFKLIMSNIEQLKPESDPKTFALQLMELGRVQMSEIDDPTERDMGFMSHYTESLSYDNSEAAFFIAYAGGCVMGLVLIDKVTREDFPRALGIIEKFAERSFT